jgi:hypothetical protein
MKSMERRDILYLTGILLVFAVVFSPAMAGTVPPTNSQGKPFQDIWDAIGVLQQQMSSFTAELAAQSARIDAGDAALQGQLNGEITSPLAEAIADGDAALQAQLRKAIQDGDAALQGQLNNEIISRQAADAALQGQLDEQKNGAGTCSCTVYVDELNALKERVAELEAIVG